MIGAILGDIIGSPYEFDCNNIKTTKFPLFSKRSQFTDDTVMTLAVAKGLIEGYDNPEKTEQEIIRAMQSLGKQYPNAGYGVRFSQWLNAAHPKPYGSFGNGSAMRVSSVAWIYNNLRDVEDYAEITAKVTHDHPEGIKGAQATAAAIFLARQGAEKSYIKQYITEKYGYDFTRTCDEIRPTYHHVESCQETVPEAITAFLEGNSFEEVIRLAVSLGGDSDTLTAIAASIASAYYGIPEALQWEGVKHLDTDLRLLWNYYVAFVEDIVKTRMKHWNELMAYMPFFVKDTKTAWIPTGKNEEKRKCFAYPSYGPEIGSLEHIFHQHEFTDYSYKDTLHRFGVKDGFEAFKEKIPTACPLLLRAMLTYLIRGERFHEGLLAKAVENDVVSEILEKLDEKKESWLCACRSNVMAEPHA